ncbi:ROK family protein [Streptomyces sp. NBC_00210]|uniref:ROK family protein n=1 Tax=unclassified Streptomyces TaxID=2593676 RepID=UPI00324F31F3
MTTSSPSRTSPTSCGSKDQHASVVAVDLGGTTIKAARLDRQGGVAEILRRPTPVQQGPQAVVDAVTAVARALVRPHTTAVGLCAPGLVNSTTGIVHFAANLGFRDVALAPAVQEQLTVPVTLQHDVRAACLAELRLGHGAGVDELLVVVLGTGLAAGIVTGGRIVHGAQGIAGEFGHIPVFADGEPCTCGQQGCVEAYAAAGALVRRYRAAGGVANGAEDVLARLGDHEVAQRIWAEGMNALGRALVTSTVLLDHQLIVLAGGMTGAGTHLLEPVRRTLRDSLAWRSAPRVRISPLGANAGLFGAALHALETIEPAGSTQQLPFAALPRIS